MAITLAAMEAYIRATDSARYRDFEGSVKIPSKSVIEGRRLEPSPLPIHTRLVPKAGQKTWKLNKDMRVTPYE